MKNKSISRFLAGIIAATVSFSTGIAQTNLGQECGCPAVTARISINISSLGVNANGELLADQTLTCNNIYVLDRKIYVPNGRTLTIQPGTLIKGNSAADPANATALIIERGGNIIADGKKECPIVFTSSADPMNGTYSLTNVGEWGGVVILGTATNNLITTNTFCAGTNGVGFVEGFSAANAFDLYGAGDAAFPVADDNDNSGIFRYVSIRHAGAIIATANELNGLSLGSVGRGTTIENVEIVANADDNIELFGGTVNLKYISTLFGDDDMFDYDLGWKGKAQFLFAIAGDSVTGLHSTDNGFEADADDNSTAPALRSHPVVYNATIIGNGHILPTADNTGPAAIMAKELTEGEFYCSVFANFRSGLNLATARETTSGNKGDAYDNWTDADNAFNTGFPNAVKHSLVVKNNTFVGFGTNPVKSFYISKGTMTTGTPKVYKNFTAASAADITQFTTTDGNTVVASVNGIDYKWSWNTAAHTSYSNNPFHTTPVSPLVCQSPAPADGFFSVVNYRGAFEGSKCPWLSEWAVNQIQTSQNTNPTDLNNDGVTNVSDFSIFIGRFGQPNN